jgi:PAS domain S-box-containing protein
VWVLEDRTALQQAEAARQDSEARLRVVVEGMAEALIVQDRKGTIVDANAAACEFLTHDLDQLRGRGLFDLGRTFLQEDGTPLLRADHPSEKVLRSGRPVRNVVIGLTSRKEEESAPACSDAPAAYAPGSPRVRWLLVNAMPLGGGAWSKRVGRLDAGVVTTFSDISAYVAAREAIRVSEERYRGLVESLPLMLVQADREGRITYFNPATRAISGFELEDIADPAAWASRLHPDDLQRVLEVRDAALRGESPRSEFRYRAKDDSEKVAFLIAQPLYRDGAIVGTTSLLLDVTRERELERELHRAQRLDLIGRLSSGVAHDFNNLLSVVLGLTDVARSHLAPEHPVYPDLLRISAAGEQAADLARQMLALGKRGEGRRSAVELNGVVRRSLELLHALLPARLQVVASLAEGDCMIEADETQVQQVVMNLCLNARDAMPEGGRLEVLTARAPAGVLLSVRDTGPGISPEIQERMFEPFFSTKEGGTGLGLAVVQRIVESFGGRIEVSSPPGGGARIDVWWPAVKEG